VLTHQIKELLNYETLRESGRIPRTHPNGFIQLDLEDSTASASTLSGYGQSARSRLHIWPHRPLVKQRSDHFIHDHRFDMCSTILMGHMVNRVYEFEEQENGTDEIQRAEYKTRHDSTITPTGIRGRTLCKHIDSCTPGEMYALRAGLLHSSTTYGYTATYMQSLRGYPEMPVNVIIPYGLWVDNDFDRFSANPPEILWEEIKRVCETVNAPAEKKHRKAYAIAAG
jgi:hypothetical protein